MPKDRIKSSGFTLQRENKILPGDSSGPRTATIAFISRPSPCWTSIDAVSWDNKISIARPSVAYKWQGNSITIKHQVQEIYFQIKENKITYDICKRNYCAAKEKYVRDRVKHSGDFMFVVYLVVTQGPRYQKK